MWKHTCSYPSGKITFSLWCCSLSRVGENTMFPIPYFKHTRRCVIIIVKNINVHILWFVPYSTDLPKWITIWYFLNIFTLGFVYVTIALLTTYWQICIALKWHLPVPNAPSLLNQGILPTGNRGQILWQMMPPLIDRCNMVCVILWEAYAPLVCCRPPMSDLLAQLILL